MRTITLLLGALFFPVAAAVAEPKADDTVNNPPFAHWSSFPVGTTQKETVILDDGGRVQHSFNWPNWRNWGNEGGGCQIPG